jgi:hypothetical protein
MPLLRYFAYVGGALLALLIVASYMFPDAPTVAARDTSKPVIRIASDRVVGPPRMDFDTTVQTPGVPGVAGSAAAANLARANALEAMAQIAPPRAAAAAPQTSPVKIEPKVEHKKTKIARHHPDRRLVSAWPQPFQPFRWMW